MYVRYAVQDAHDYSLLIDQWKSSYLSRLCSTLAGIKKLTWRSFVPEPPTHGDGHVE